MNAIPGRRLETGEDPEGAARLPKWSRAPVTAGGPALLQRGDCCSRPGYHQRVHPAARSWNRWYRSSAPTCAPPRRRVGRARASSTAEIDWIRWPRASDGWRRAASVSSDCPAGSGGARHAPDVLVNWIAAAMGPTPAAGRDDGSRDHESPASLRSAAASVCVRTHWLGKTASIGLSSGTGAGRRSAFDVAVDRILGRRLADDRFQVGRNGRVEPTEPR